MPFLDFEGGCEFGKITNRKNSLELNGKKISAILIAVIFLVFEPSASGAGCGSKEVTECNECDCAPCFFAILNLQKHFSNKTQGAIRNIKIKKVSPAATSPQQASLTLAAFGFCSVFFLHTL